MSKIIGGGGSKGDGGAAAAAAQRQQEEADRQAKITQGLTAINDSFSGFGDDFFQSRARASDEFFLPQLEDQFTQGNEAILAQLARAGLLKSTAANTAQADLRKQFELQQGSIRNRGQQAASDLESRVNAERNALVAQLQASANPEIAASSASAATRALRDTAPEFSPLAQVLTPTVAAGTNFLEAQRDARLLSQAPQSSDPRRMGGAFRVG